jgi:L-2-hydroxyglutarate oxidase
VPSSSCRFLIMGAGITGLTIARELVRRGAEDILVLDKEPELGTHASGRNSGVLHAGIYYTPDSFKARFCVRGNRLMKEFCREKGLTLEETGKVIVAKDESELEGLHELKRRADASGAIANLIDKDRLKDLEPYAATFAQAIHAPETAVIRPKEILGALIAELESSQKVTMSWGTALAGRAGRQSAETSGGSVQFEKMINVAGAHADTIARWWGLGREYRMLPFKGTYKKLIPERIDLVRGNIYPVPDLDRPFLGVHLTRSADDEVSVGPTAIPAFGRENYRLFEGWGRESLSILGRDALLLLRDRSFRRAALGEVKKYSTRVVLRDAKALVPSLRREDLLPSRKVGIRPQLVHWPTKRLVMDFVIVEDEDSFHVLNAISPAFTSSIAFAEHAVSVLLGERKVRDAV